MNYFHDEKHVWVLPERTGSRAIGQLLNFWTGYTFHGDVIEEIGRRKNENRELAQSYNHEWQFKYKDAKDYIFCLRVRNPYSRMLSYYKSLFLKLDCQEEQCQYSFKEFMEIRMIKNKYIWHLEYENVFNETKIDYIIHLENIEKELMEVPMIKKKYNESQEFREEWERVITNNIFTKESEGNETKLTEEDAEIVYNSFPKQFELFGYSKDSWKYL
jgi:hypothetical protein